MVSASLHQVTSGDLTLCPAQGPNGQLSCAARSAPSCKDSQRTFTWQRDTVWVAHHIMEYFEVFGALDDAPDDASLHHASALQPAAGEM